MLVQVLQKFQLYSAHRSPRKAVDDPLPHRHSPTSLILPPTGPFRIAQDTKQRWSHRWAQTGSKGDGEGLVTPC
ncbi:unnamed protein product [Vitrella brassicaformis CCMP3155]|uniref:Uncharacterized protein n=1 Tax=Vitrella brassicaformis (strain CCMP3155) TaxID=1169540 RepID=A0A0G4EXM9_VITBC|nr:unnamed protein product [Vitrella brassicaformis CCMP3155]|eukprot:CEM04064.1 unnamed protein product [Vitrella brassicaformis CCMP3155]